MIALNGDVSNWGSWFDSNNQPGIASMLKSMNNIIEATMTMRKLNSDEQAACRRVSIAICKNKLITDSTKGRLRSEASAKAAAGLARRQAARSV